MDDSYVPESRKRPRGRRPMLIRLLLVALACYGGVCLLMYLFQGRLLYFPVRPLAGTPRDVGLEYQDLWLPVGEEERIHGWYVPCEGGRGTVIWCHGNAGNVSHRLETLALLHRLRLSVLIFDYRGYGQSDGRPGEAATYDDAEAAARHAVDALGVPPDRLVIWGRSLGVAVAAELARRRPPAALILESGFPSVPELGQRLYPWLPVQWLARYRYDAAARLAEVTCPKLLIHSAEDEMIPYALGQTLFESAAPPREMVTIRGGHNEGFLVSGAEYRDPVDAFLTRVLGR